MGKFSDELTSDLLDAGRRASDLINEIFRTGDWDELRHSFLAIRLADGSSDGVLYPDKRTAIKYQKYEKECYYVALRGIAGGSNPRDMAIIIKYAREAFKSPLVARMVDPDHMYGGSDLIISAQGMDTLRSQFDRDLMREKIGKLLNK